jgi:hypothetical protein
VLIVHTCSWCEDRTPAPLGTDVTCPRCGHRADLPRLACDCGACASRRDAVGGRPWEEVIFGPDHRPPANPA